MKSCPKLDTIRLAIEDGTLPDGKREEILRHVEVCPLCREVEREEMAVRELLASRAVWIDLPGEGCLTDDEALRFVDGGADGLARARAVAHLAVCDPCAGEIEAIGGPAVEDADADVAPELPSSLQTRLLRVMSSGSSSALQVVSPATLQAPPVATIAPARKPTTGERTSARTTTGERVSARANRATPSVPTASSSGTVRRGRTRTPSSSFKAVARPGRSSRSNQVVKRIGRRRDPMSPFLPVAAAAAVVLAAGLFVSLLRSGDPTPVGPDHASARHDDDGTGRRIPSGPLVADRLDDDDDASGRPAPDAGAGAGATAEPDAGSTETPIPSWMDDSSTDGGGETPEAGSESGAGSSDGSETPPTSPTSPTTRPPERAGADGGTTIARRGDPRTTTGLTLRLAMASGVSVLASETGKYTPLKGGEPVVLTDGTRIKASRRGAFLLLDDRIEVYLERNVEAVLRKPKKGKPELFLADGRVLCEVERHRDPVTFAVTTDAARFTLTGTIFGVAAHGDSGTASLAVAEGRVLTENEHGSTEVVEGQLLSCTASSAPPAGEKGDVGRALSWARSIRPKDEVVYEADFLDGRTRGWEGTSVPAADGGFQVLKGAPTPDAKYWSAATKLKPGKKVFGVREGTRIKMTIWLEHQERVILQCYNATQGLYFQYHFGEVKGGQWITLTIPAHALKTYEKADQNPLRDGDSITSVELFSGDAGTDFTLLLRDCEIYHRTR